VTTYYHWPSDRIPDGVENSVEQAAARARLSTQFPTRFLTGLSPGRSSIDEGPAAGPSRLPTSTVPLQAVSGRATSNRVFDRLVEGEGVN